MNFRHYFIFLLAVGILTGCSGSHLIVNDNGKEALSQCFPLPNCVSSDSFMFFNHVSPLELAMPADQAWPLVQKIIKDMPRTRLVTENDRYIHVKCISRVFRFVDNLELILDEQKNMIAIRSGSTIALWDIGANWYRTHQVRQLLKKDGIIK